MLFSFVLTIEDHTMKIPLQPLRSRLHVTSPFIMFIKSSSKFNIVSMVTDKLTGKWVRHSLSLSKYPSKRSKVLLTKTVKLTVRVNEALCKT